MTFLTERRQFLAHYERIRTAEGRGSADAEYYRALPYGQEWHWKMRARTFDYLRRLLPSRPARILDLGAGNCWLSYRLGELGHTPVAIDIFTDERDGLQARRHYPTPPPAAEADFHQLPFASSTFDLAIFNASIHYSPDYARVLEEARRCLRPGGRVIVLDSPVYQKREHGEKMRAERHAQFEKQYGFRSEALRSIEYFDVEMLSGLERELKMHWTIHKPWYGWSWHMRPMQAKLRGKRPPSRFWILEGSFAS